MTALEKIEFTASPEGLGPEVSGSALARCRDDGAVVVDLIPGWPNHCVVIYKKEEMLRLAGLLIKAASSERK